jgi:hypothetical protein
MMMHTFIFLYQIYFSSDNAVNVYLGPSEERRLLTGRHEVADIFCICCHELLGWKYISAQDPSQKYKEGHFILEKPKIRSSNNTMTTDDD